MSAILLPYDVEGTVDWKGFSDHVTRTFDAGLIPAVNMDTGYANLIDESTRQKVLEQTRQLANGRQYVAGAFVGDQPGDDFQPAAYAHQIKQIAQQEGTPIVMQSHGLVRLESAAIVEAHHQFAQSCDQFIAFELGQQFAPFGKIYDLATYREIMQIEKCIGAKHSSLRRQPEWDRLALRDEVRPDFMVLTGNDLAIDMVMYGSDYLLGLSAFAPESFAHRDALWQQCDRAFFEWNDILQYLGCFAFRDPVPAYKHSAAQFLKLRGWIEHDGTHPGSPQRPDSDRSVLKKVLHALETLEVRPSGR